MQEAGGGRGGGYGRERECEETKGTHVPKHSPIRFLTHPLAYFPAASLTHSLTLRPPSQHTSSLPGLATLTPTHSLVQPHTAPHAQCIQSEAVAVARVLCTTVRECGHSLVQPQPASPPSVPSPSSCITRSPPFSLPFPVPFLSRAQPHVRIAPSRAAPRRARGGGGMAIDGCRCSSQPRGFSGPLVNPPLSGQHHVCLGDPSLCRGVYMSQRGRRAGRGWGFGKLRSLAHTPPNSIRMSAERAGGEEKAGVRVQGDSSTFPLMRAHAESACALQAQNMCYTHCTGPRMRNVCSRRRQKRQHAAVARAAHQQDK